MKSSSEKLEPVTETSIFDFKIKNLEGQLIDFNKFKGRKAFLFVNVACACGLTSDNYKQLVDIYTKYRQRGLEVLGFPCNQFYSQQSGSEKEIRQFVSNKFNVTFPMFSKIQVNGENTHPIYRYLRLNSELYDPITTTTKLIPWNFAKFLVNREGKVVKFAHSKVQPKQLLADIQELLKN